MGIFRWGRSDSSKERYWWDWLFPSSEHTVFDDIDPDSERGFAPANPLDGRDVGEWRSRYPRDAHHPIAVEAVYLAGQGICFLLICVLAWLAARGYVLTVSGGIAFRQHDNEMNTLVGLGFLGFFGGGLGGTVFGLKWLYHSVAKGTWSLDRRLWRLFTPWISAILAVAVVALIAGDVLAIFQADALRHPSTTFGLSFLVGLFSDITLGKLAEVVQVLFGRVAEQHPPGHHQVERKTEVQERKITEDRTVTERTEIEEEEQR